MSNMLSECAPIEVRKTMVMNDMAFSKLLQINNLVDQMDIGEGAYVNAPDI